MLVNNMLCPNVTELGARRNPASTRQRVAEAAGGASSRTVFRDVAQAAGPVDEHHSRLGRGRCAVLERTGGFPREKKTQRGDLSEIAQFGGGSSWLAGRSGQFAPQAARNADAARSDHLTRQYYGRLLLLQAATAVRQGC